jgi:hypothetical protein
MKSLRQTRPDDAARKAAGSGVDSRQYIFAFPIESVFDIPADFDSLPGIGVLRAGVFLPQDDQDWLGRRDYPARVVLLTEQEAVVADHPAERGALLRVPIRRIQTVECGHSLLLGWFVLTWEEGAKRLPYNTRTEDPVRRYLETLKDQWLPAPLLERPQRCEAFGQPLTFKFEYARSAELLPGETALVQFFHPPVRQVRGWSVFRREYWFAGDLLLVTSRRLLWITDCYKGRYECYGTTSLSAPLESISDVWSGIADCGAELKISFRSGHSWHIPFGETEECETRKIEQAIWRVLNEITQCRG